VRRMAGIGHTGGLGSFQKAYFKYEEHVRAGKHSVIVQGNAEDVARVRGILQDTTATALHVHSQASA
jgi:hypothetical protein